MMLGKLQRAHSTLRGHFAPAYLVGSNMLRAYIYSLSMGISYFIKQEVTKKIQLYQEEKK